MTLNDDYIAQVERDARKYQGQWTGTAGTLAAHCMRLLKERREYMADRVEEAFEPYKRRAGPLAGCKPAEAAAAAALSWSDPAERQRPAASPAESLLLTAAATVRDRRGTYGPPNNHFTITVGLVNALLAAKLREPLTADDWARIMICDKLARDAGPGSTPDTPIDLAGYAACLAEVRGLSPPR